MTCAEGTAHARALTHEWSLRPSDHQTLVTASASSFILVLAVLSI